MSFSKYYRERVKQLEAENSELRAQIERMQEVSKALALRSAKLDPVEAENAKLKAELKAIKDGIKTKYQQANDVFGLNLGELKKDGGE